MTAPVVGSRPTRGEFRTTGDVRGRMDGPWKTASAGREAAGGTRAVDQIQPETKVTTSGRVVIWGLNDPVANSRASAPGGARPRSSSSGLECVRDSQPRQGYVRTYDIRYWAWSETKTRQRTWSAASSPAPPYRHLGRRDQRVIGHDYGESQRGGRPRSPEGVTGQA